MLLSPMLALLVQLSAQCPCEEPKFDGVTYAYADGADRHIARSPFVPPPSSARAIVARARSWVGLSVYASATPHELPIVNRPTLKVRISQMFPVGISEE